MRAIIISDTHFDEYSNYPGKAESDLNIYAQVYAYARKAEIKFVIHAGDLFDKNSKVSSSIYGKAYSIMDKALKDDDIVTYIVPGNHDILKMNSFDECILRPFGKELISSRYISRENIVVWTPSVVVAPDGTVVAFIPFSDDREQIKASIDSLLRVNKIDLLVGHFALKESSVNYDAKVEMIDLILPNIERVVLGHIHKKERIPRGGFTPVVHVGSLFQRNFGEEDNETGFWVFNSEGDGAGMTFIPVESLRFKTVKVQDQDEYKTFLKSYKKGDYSEYITRVKYGRDFTRVTRNFTEEFNVTEFGAGNTQSRRIDIESDMPDLLKRYVEERLNPELSKEFALKVGKKIVGVQ